MKNRREFFGSTAAIGMLVATPSTAKSRTQDEEKPKKQIESKLVSQFVGKSHGDIETVKSLLKKEPLLVHASWDWGNGDFESGLNAASHVGRRDVADLLLENGARLDVPAAVMLGMTDVVKAMMKHLPQLHSVPGAHGIPLISHAIFGKDKAEEIFQMLLDGGADVNAGSNMKMTPLMAAASLGRPEQLAALLKHGADVHAKDTKGRTALDMATKRDRPKCIKILNDAALAADFLC